MVRTSSFVSLFIGLVLTVAGALHAQTWEGQLKDGSRVRVDPRTNRPVVSSPEGVVTPLWDGVHRLRDGSSITVREGVMVPNREVIELRRGTPTAAERPFAATGAPPCVVLVRKVCGLNDQCAEQAACSHARQLRDIGLEEERELAAAGTTSGFAQTPGQCAEALRDEAFFVPCRRRIQADTSSPCGELVNKVCGTANQCAGQAGCALARQLLDMEYQDRLKTLQPERITDSGKQCRQAASDVKTFPPCGR